MCSESAADYAENFECNYSSAGDAVNFGVDGVGVGVGVESEESSNIETYAILSRNLVQFCVPLLIFIGTFGNLLTIAVLLRRLRSIQANSTNFYLCVLSVADLGCIYVGLPNYFLSHVYSIDLRDTFEIFCRLQTFLVYFFSHFAVWTLSIVTIDRTIWTALPFRAKELCTIRRAKIIVVLMGLTLILIDNHFLWTLHLADIRATYNASEPIIRCTEYEIFEEFARVGVAWLDLFELSIIPFAILITCNCIIIVKLRQYASVRNSLLSSRSTKKCNVSSAESQAATALSTNLSATTRNAPASSHSCTMSSSKEHSLTMMLVTTSVFFIATTLPITVCNFIYVTLDTALRSDESSAESMTLFQTFATLLSYLNISVQFVLFCLSGKSFRIEVKSYLLEFFSCIRICGASQRKTHSQHRLRPQNIKSNKLNGASSTYEALDQTTMAADTDSHWLTSSNVANNSRCVVST